jgi:hypothetical protein
MNFFHHESIRNYTLAMKSTFNDVETQYTLDSGQVISEKVPIVFTTREKATIIGEQDTKNILNGNINTIPRMSLVFNGMQPARSRSKNKFLKINKNIDGEQIQYQYNSSPWDFSYTIICICRGMREAAMVTEQITSVFNPSYHILVNEMPLQDEPTSIQLNLNDVQFEFEEYDEHSTNLTTITFDFTLKGNIYPSIKEQGVLEKIQYWLNIGNKQEYNRASLTEFDGSDVKKYDFGPDFGKIPPVITSVEKKDNENNIELEVMFTDIDGQINDDYQYVWNVIEGVNTVSTGSKKVLMTNNIGSTKISVQIIDMNGNQSNLYIEDVIVN